MTLHQFNTRPTRYTVFTLVNFTTPLKHIFKSPQGLTGRGI